MKLSFKHELVEHNNIRYGYVGKGNDSQIVFIHGFSVAPQFYAPYLEKLGNDYEIIAPDLTRLDVQPNTALEYSELISGMLNNMNVDIYNLIGYSYGGGISMTLANHTEDNPQKMVCINPVIDTNYGPAGYIYKGLKMTVKEMFRYGIGGNPKRGNIAKDALRFFTTHTKECYRNLEDIANFSTSKLKIWQATRFIFSDNDDFFKMKDIDFNAFDNAEYLEIPGSDHDLFFNKRDSLLYYLTKDFIDGKLSEIGNMYEYKR